MASHHYHHHQDIRSPPFKPADASCCTCSSGHCSTESNLSQHQHQHQHPSPPPPSVDQLLQLIASYLSQQQQQQQPQVVLSPHQNRFCSPRINTHQTYKQQNLIPQSQETQFVLSSLLKRIDALESSLHSFSASSGYRFSSSLRDLAARVIQTHFRAFLVRRSKALGQIKHLALIKSNFISLKSSVSNKTHFDFEAVSHKTMGLLLRLDSVQGGDPMIRDGKRSLSRDLVKFLDFIDGYAMKRREILYRKNTRLVDNSSKSRVLGSKFRTSGGDQSEEVEKLRHRVEKIRGFSRISEKEDELEGFRQVTDSDDDDDEEEESPRMFIKAKDTVSTVHREGLVNARLGQSRVKKNVRFADSGELTRVYGDTLEPTLSKDGIDSVDQSVSSDEQGQEMENLLSEVKEIKGLLKETENYAEEEAHMDGSRDSSESSYEDFSFKREVNSPGNSETDRQFRGRNPNIHFSAPLPLKMEARADLRK